MALSQPHSPLEKKKKNEAELQKEKNQNKKIIKR